MNTILLHKLVADFGKNFERRFKKVLSASATHGSFGMPLVDSLHESLPVTFCENCGECCNSISIFSLEYHRIVRDLMSRFSILRLREIFSKAFRFDERLAEAGDEKRIRCAFRHEESRVCIIHPIRPFACRFFGLQKPDKTRECQRVQERTPSQLLTQELMVHLQQRIFENSEFFDPFPEKKTPFSNFEYDSQTPPGIPFFPFEFWLYRFAFGSKLALQIYREIIIPASTPLNLLWSQTTS